MHCEACDLGFLVGGTPTDYVHGYRNQASHRADGSPTSAAEIFGAYHHYQQQRLDAVLPYLKPDSHVLEIGASAGQFLVHLEGWCARRCAIELDTACCAHMDGLGIETSYRKLPDSRFADDAFDIVCAFQTMEHVAQPISFLKDIRAAMAPGATAFIEVPSLGDPLLTVLDVPAYHRFFYHAYHLTYWSEKSLRNAACMAGFDPEKIAVHATQDYGLLNHLHWLLCGGPQDDCHAGLGLVKISGKDAAMAVWLSEELNKLNALYMSKLQAQGTTSNLMLTVRV